jgi:endonuclease/exonuclease/phosphatase family metal-dependent hydrolase
VSEEEKKITDKLTGDYLVEFNNLKAELDRVIPPKRTDSNVLIATWNIMSFGDLTEKWTTGRGDKPKRHVRALKYITEIVSRFDVVAIQEVKGSLKALRHMLKALGPDWSFMMSDEIKGSGGNYERFAFVFDTRRVKLSGLAGELVIPTKELRTEAYPIEKQFARTPYAVGFIAGGTTFVLVTLHVVFGGDNEVENKDRAKEIAVIAKWLADWAIDVNIWEHNLITLGDFNIDRKGDHLYEAFISGGLDIHEHFYDLPRTIYDLPKDVAKRKFYDQIAWFTGYDGKPALSLKFLKGGFFDFTSCVFGGMSKRKLAARMSDHFPLWAEFQIMPKEEEGGWDEEFPAAPKPTRAQKEIQEKNMELRKRVIRVLTELDNAYMMYTSEAAEIDFELEHKADKYLKNYLFTHRLINDFRDKLKADDVTEDEPVDRAKELAEKTVEVLAGKKVVTEDLMKETIKKFNTWPFERRWVG